MKLGTLLLRNAAIGLAQLEGALRNQVLYGGRLGTNLVELGFIDLELLSTYLSDLTGVPVATPTLLDDADTTLLDRLGADEAHRLRSVPLGYLGEGTDHVAAAMVDPFDAGAIDQLAERLGARVTPYVVPELRALYYLERHFGLPRRARFLRTARSRTEHDHEDRRRTQPAQGMVMPPAFTLAPRRHRASQAPLASPGGEPITVTYGVACERIEAANHREEIADVFVDFARGRCDALVVFLIRDGNAFGWRSYTPDGTAPRTPIEELSLPLGGASALQSAHDAGAPFTGVPPSAARPIETKLWTALATPEPPAVVVVPVLVKQRAVNLVYAHLLGGPPPHQLVVELSELAKRAQTSYLRLIRQARGA